MFFIKRPSLRKPAIKLSVFLALFVFSQNIDASTISGYVFNKARVALPDVDVELLNEYRAFRNRVKTDGSGRYTFSGLADGTYFVKVLPFRYDLEDQEAMVEITTIKITGSGQGNVYQQQDFYLVPKRGSLAETELGVIFAQEVPANAKKLYDIAIQDLSKNRPDEGVQGLRNAIAAFPDYYAAVYRLGAEMFARKQYGESAQLFIKAAAINEKSATSFYYIGYSLHNLGKEYNKAAIVALENSLALAPASIQVLYLLGKIERVEGSLVNAEKHLTQAKKLSRISIPEIHRELAQLYGNELKKYDQAADELELYVKASKLSADEEQKTKKVIIDLRTKAKASLVKTS